MNKFIKVVAQKILGEKNFLRFKKFRADIQLRREAKKFLSYDYDRICKYSGVKVKDSKDALLACIIADYHVIEKGLTMPNRRFIFGVGVVHELMGLIEKFESQFGGEEPQLRHAIGVIKEYYELHKSNGIAEIECAPNLFKEMQKFVERYCDVPPSRQLHFKRADFYAKRNSAFPEFAASRRTVRHYANSELPIERITSAVKLALTTPTACNRQHCRVYCVSDREIITEILTIQQGNRGFGHLADKLLIVTSDLEDLIGVAERNDAYINGGLFLMNLCYALHWQEVAHCILNWSRTPDEDLSLRKILPIKDSESVIAVLTCGEAPLEFDVASSPRKAITSVFVNILGGGGGIVEQTDSWRRHENSGASRNETNSRLCGKV